MIHREICDLMKQVRTIQEPFTSADLADLVLVSRPTAKVWVEALAGEGLLDTVGTTQARNGKILPLYKRIGAFA